MYTNTENISILPTGYAFRFGTIIGIAMLL
jgi:hypothetical protein